MTFFLRLFPQFRALQQELLEAGNARIIAEERQLQAQAERDRVWELLRESLTNERGANGREQSAYRMVANFAVQSKYGVVPFPDAPTLPANLVDPGAREPIRRNTVTAEELEREQWQRYHEKVAQLRKQQQTQ